MLALFAVIGTGFVFVRPEAAACAAIDLIPLTTLSDGSLGDRGLAPADRRVVVGQRAEAVRRVTRIFGAPRAEPRVVHLSRADALWPAPFNSFGSAVFLPGRTCIVIGPDGRNVDVFAHELVHAEIVDRVGYWRRWVAIPVWFDEGAGMQADFRPEFGIRDPQDRRQGDAVKRMATHRAFFGGTPGQVVTNYAQAKRVVANWLDRTGRRNFYRKLAAIRDGARFEAVWAE